MREIWRVAVQEVLSGRRFLWAAAAIGVAVPFAVAPTRYDPEVVALVLALALSHGVALLAGAAMIHAPLREGRLGFYFSRPISEGGLWWGKCLGTTGLALLIMVATFAPGLVWTTLQGGATTGLVRMATLSAAALPVSVLVGHAVAAVLGAPGRQRWFNLALGLSFTVLAVLCLSRLTSSSAMTAAVLVVGLFGLALFVGMFVGGCRQVRQGRVEIARATVRTLWFSGVPSALRPS